MEAWEKEKNSEEYKQRVQISEQATRQRRELKRQAHAARQNIVHAKKIQTALFNGLRTYENLYYADRKLLDDLNSGKLYRVRDECDEAFGWNKQMRDAAGSAAPRIHGVA